MAVSEGLDYSFGFSLLINLGFFIFLGLRKVLHRSGDGAFHDSGDNLKAFQKNAGKLNEELVVKILARLGFPNILKCRQLSKAWRLRFLQDSGDAYARAFQDEVKSVSSTWPSMCPILRTREHFCGYELNLPTREHLCGYELNLRKWNKIPTACFKGKFFDQYKRTKTPAGEIRRWERTSLVGALKIMRVYIPELFSYYRLQSMSLENLINKTSKVLVVPPLQIVFDPHFWVFLGETFHLTKDGFIIVVYYQNNFEPRNDEDVLGFGKYNKAIQVYDSRNHVWKEKYFLRSQEDWDDINHLSLSQDSVLMILLDQKRPKLIQYDIWTEDWNESELFEQGSNLHRANLHSLRLVLCGSRKIIVGHESMRDSRHRVHLFEYDDESRGLRKVNDELIIHAPGLKPYRFTTRTEILGYLVAIWLRPGIVEQVFGVDEHLYLAVAYQSSHSLFYNYSLTEGKWELWTHDRELNQSDKHGSGEGDFLWPDDEELNKEGSTFLSFERSWFCPGVNPFLSCQN